LKKTKKKRSSIDGKWTYIENDITDSAPWKDLPPSACYLYFEIRKKWAGRDRANIIFAHSEMRDFMAGSTFEGHRDKLIMNGFIDVVERGGLWGREAIFALSDRWKKWGKKDFIVVDIDKIFPKNSHFFRKGHKFYGKE